MTPKEIINASGDVLRQERGLVLGGLGAAVTMTGVQIAAIAFRAHGDRSHRANGLNRFWQHTYDKAMWLMTTDPVSWSTAHVANGEVNGEVEGYVHHGMTDANIYPAYEIERYLRVVENDPDRYVGYPVLDRDKSIPNLDPKAEFTYNEVRALGSFAFELLDSVLDVQHEPKTEYTIDEAKAVLDTSKPRYVYGNPKRKPKDEDYTSDEMAEIILRDSYSPALEPTDERIRNGVYGTYKNNVTRFQSPTDLFRRKPEISPSMYEECEVLAPRNKLGPVALFGASITTFTAYNVIKKGVKPKNAILGITVGALAPVGGIYGPIKGGEIVNSGGHAGKLDLKKLFRMWRNKPEKIEPNDDGSYMTQIEGKSIPTKAVMKLVSLFFVDELEGQPAHHKMPWKRQYSFFDGLKGWITAPLTSFVQNRSNAKHLRFGFRPGEGFGDEFGGKRPDMPNTAVTKIIQPARVRTMRKEKVV